MRTSLTAYNDVDDVMLELQSYVAEEREKALVTLVSEEKLKEAETRAFVEGAFEMAAEIAKLRKKQSSKSSRLSLNCFGT